LVGILTFGVAVGAPSIVLLVLPSRSFSDLVGAVGGAWITTTAAVEHRRRRRST
jgi:hypothetical protein